MRNSLQAASPSVSYLEWQQRLLEEAQEGMDHLSVVLERNGADYDDLTYKRSGERVWPGGPAPALDDLQREPADIPVVSFFTGCGGMDLGFEAAGFKHLCAFEFNELFCNTLRRNRPQWRVFGPPTHLGDLSQVDEIVQALAGVVSSPFEGIFIGGPPCQPLPIASNQRFSKSGANFKRVGFDHERNGGLLFDYIELILEFKPAVFVIENVPGLRDIDGGSQLSSAVRTLFGAGYDINQPVVLDAADFGVPQRRNRLFVIGTRLARWIQLPPARQGHIGCGAVLPDRVPAAPNNETRKHRASSVARYMALDYGARDQLGRVDRLDPSLPAKTVIAGGSGGGGRSHLHPEIPRTLSVRECARLQSFPDDYVFVGPTARQFTQVGNAVPPVLAAQLASEIRDAME
ncbi:MAG: DNA cytosine methyltransferase [Gammaproteobacteria bacterium]|nr:DNA cytosine methyltransferase [Gammaproteobacteria bacterium]